MTKIAIRLRYLVEECIPCEMEAELVTRSHSKIITKEVIQAAREAGGEEHKACVVCIFPGFRFGLPGIGLTDQVYCLLICKRWFYHQALVELWDATMHQLRATACEVLAKQMYASRSLSRLLQ